MIIKITTVITLILGVIILSSSFNHAASGKVDPKAIFEAYCGSCHLPPDPQDLPKDIWQNHVLPAMAARLGISYPNYNPEEGLKPAEIDTLKKHNYFPEQLLISQNDWDIIVNYILKKAPENDPLDSVRLFRNRKLKQFIRKDFPIDGKPGSMITGLKYNSVSKKLWIADINKTVSVWQYGKGVIKKIKTESPVVDFDFHGDTTYFTEIGNLYPTELYLGSFVQYYNNSQTTLLSSLHRPVHGEVCDLDNDGIPEIIVANFGNKLGSLSIYKKDKITKKYVEEILLPMPGATKFYTRDMNGDGKKDIVALFAQGDESVYIFYQKANLTFSAKRVVRFPPDYGSTDLVLVDYNHDGHPDIVTAQGDNADFSEILKRFHGIRLFLNDGQNNFSQEFFYPIYGATQVIADDFDQDGDIDFAVTSFFPDYGSLIDESFVYLENTNADKFRFKSFVLKNDVPVKSLTMTEGDINSDGDNDIMLGLFSHSPVSVPPGLQQKWDSSKNGLTIFFNQLKHH